MEVELSKKCTLLWREAHVEIKCTKHTRAGPLLEVELLRKCMQSTLTSQNAHSTPTSDHFWKLTCRKSAHRCSVKHMSKAKCQRTTCSDNSCGPSNVVLHGRRGDLALWFCSSFRNDGRPGTFGDYLGRCILRGKRGTRDIFIRDVRRSG